MLQNIRQLTFKVHACRVEITQYELSFADLAGTHAVSSYFRLTWVQSVSKCSHYTLMMTDGRTAGPGLAAPSVHLTVSTVYRGAKRCEV
jgi:hypothetical protein